MTFGDRESRNLISWVVLDDGRNMKDDKDYLWRCKDTWSSIHLLNPMCVRREREVLIKWRNLNGKTTSYIYIGQMGNIMAICIWRVKWEFWKKYLSSHIYMFDHHLSWTNLKHNDEKRTHNYKDQMKRGSASLPFPSSQVVVKRGQM